LAAIQSRTIRLGQTVSLTASATDSDVPAQALTFDLVSPFPNGAQIDGNSGLFAWTPAANQAPSTNNITIRVTDNGVPRLSASRSFVVIVLLPPKASISRNSGQVTMVFDTIPGRLYKVQYKESLSETTWHDLTTPEAAGGNSIAAADSLSAGPQRFYRIVQLD
jgi:hypothetical protein